MENDQDTLASQLERIATNLSTDYSHSHTPPEEDWNYVLEQAQDVIQFLVPFLFASDSERISPSGFVWNDSVALHILTWIVRRQSSLMLPVIQAVLHKARQLPLQKPSAVVSDRWIQTLFHLIQWPDLQVSEQATRTIVTLTLYYHLQGESSWKERLVAAMCVQAAVLPMDSTRMMGVQASTDGMVDSIPYSTRIIRLASTLIQCMSIDQILERDKSEEKTNHPIMTGLQDGTWIQDLAREYVKQSQGEPCRSTSEPLSFYALQCHLLDLLFVQPFCKTRVDTMSKSIPTHEPSVESIHDTLLTSFPNDCTMESINSTRVIRPLDPQDSLSRMTLLDLMDSMVQSCGNDTYILSWILSTPVLWTLFSLLGCESSEDDPPIYTIPPGITHNTEEKMDMVEPLTNYLHDTQIARIFDDSWMEKRTIDMGEEEEKGFVLGTLSHIFHRVFQSMNPPVVPLEPNQLYLWNGFHRVISYFISSILFHGRKSSQEAQRFAFMDAMVSYVTTHPYILSCLLDTYEATKNNDENGPLHLLWDTWLNLRHASVPFKAAMLHAMAQVLENDPASIPFSLRWKFISSIGQINGCNHGITIWVQICRTSPSVEVRLGAYRCLHVLSREEPVVQILLQDSRLGFLDWISGALGPETTKEGKEAKYLLLSRILENNISKDLLSEKWYKELDKMVRNGPFSKSMGTLWDPLVE